MRSVTMQMTVNQMRDFAKENGIKLTKTKKSDIYKEIFDKYNNLPKEDFQGFINAYILNVQKVSKKTFLRLNQDIDEDLLNGDICWMTTDNMVTLLSKNEGEFYDSKKFEQILTDSLMGNKLIIIRTDNDEGSLTHFLSLIGSYGKAYLVEYTKNECPHYEESSVNKMVRYMVNILVGVIPDTFYGEIEKRNFNIEVYDRFDMNSELIRNL